MARKRMKNEVFLDTSYAVALSSPKDSLHQKAVHLATQIKATGTLMITTQAVMLEIGNSLSKQHYRRAAVSLLYALEADPRIENIPLSKSLYDRAFQLYRNRMDKEWGLIDCVSFVVMSERGITDALTADIHFQQAGFRALLCED
jgi:predicted nucleic acid-binding protein